MKNLFLGLAVFALIACGGKNDAAPGAVAAGGSSAQPAAAPATPPPLIPSSMRGAYVTDDYHKNKLAVSATGISRSGIYSGSLTMNAGRIDGTSYIVDGSEYSGDKSRSGNNNCRGSIDLQGQNLAVTLTGNKGCGEILSGSYVRTVAGKGGGDKRRSDDDYAEPVRAAKPMAAVKARAIAAVEEVKAAVAPSAAAPAESSASPDGFAVGSRVSCNWKSGGVYYNGRIARISGSRVHINYDDGDKEVTTTSKCRLVGGGSDRPSVGGGGSADTKRVKIKVKLKRTKANGKAWDAWGGEPDIAICVSGDNGTQCYPDGGSVMEILEPECQDSYSCTFRNVEVPKDGFELTIVDVDVMANDVAGSEDCDSRGSCTVGRAKATIR